MEIILEIFQLQVSGGLEFFLYVAPDPAEYASEPAAYLLELFVDSVANGYDNVLYQGGREGGREERESNRGVKQEWCNETFNIQKIQYITLLLVVLYFGDFPIKKYISDGF